MPDPRRKMVKVNALSYGKLVALMLDGVHSCLELAELTGLHYVTVLQYTRELHSAGAAYIDHWEKDSFGRDAIKVYRIGRGKDAKRTRIAAAKRTAAYRAKKHMQTITQALVRPHQEQPCPA